MDKKLEALFHMEPVCFAEEIAELQIPVGNRTEDRIRRSFSEKSGLNLKRAHRNRTAKIITGKRSIAAAAIIVLVVSMSAAIGHAAYVHFFVRPAMHSGGAGVHVDISHEKEKKAAESETYYLQLNYIPDRYKRKEELFFNKKNSDTDFFTVAFFHLDSHFENILPGGELFQIETQNSEAYFASNKWENRLWIRFREGDYLAEIRDSNKNLSNDEIKKIAEAAAITSQKPKNAFETLEWTDELERSYENWLKKWASADN